MGIFVRCPADLPCIGWYERMGPTLEGSETTRSGRRLNLWRLTINRRLKPDNFR